MKYILILGLGLSIGSWLLQPSAPATAAVTPALKAIDLSHSECSGGRDLASVGLGCWQEPDRVGTIVR